MSPIHRFQEVDERLATAAQPAAQDIEWLRREGFEAVVNLSTPTAKNFLPEEAKLVLQAGMAYVHAPVDCSNLVAQHYQMVKGVLEGLKGKKVLLHCAGNVKSSGMMYLYRVKELGHHRDALLEQLRTQDWHEAKWFSYFERMGA